MAGPLRITGALPDLVRLHPWLDDALSGLALTAGQLNGIHVAIEEVVMNVAMHAAPDPAQADIAIELTVEADAVTIAVEDNGPVFDPTTATPPLAGFEPGGLGLRLLHHFCQDMQYSRMPGRNRLALRFPYSPASA